MVATTLPTRALAQVASGTDGAIRVGPLLGIPPLLSELGLDPGAVILEAGVDPGPFDDPENFIGFAAMGRLLAHCATRTGCPHFGLLAGKCMGLEALRLVGMLMERSPDVGSALNNVVLHLHPHLHDRGAVPTLTVEGERALFGYAIYQPGPEGAGQIYDGPSPSTSSGPCAVGTGGRTEVLFSHSRPADTRPVEAGLKMAPCFLRYPMLRKHCPDWSVRDRLIYSDKIFLFCGLRVWIRSAGRREYRRGESGRCPGRRPVGERGSPHWPAETPNGSRCYATADNTKPQPRTAEALYLVEGWQPPPNHAISAAWER
jgi:hypothetical protein